MSPKNLLEEVRLLVVAGLLLGASAGKGDEGSDAFKQGRELLESGQVFQAAYVLERAVAFRPDADRYRRFLDKAIDAALEWTVRNSYLYDATRYTDFEKIVQACAHFAPKDTRTITATKQLGTMRSQLLGALDSAISAAKRGEFETANLEIARVAPHGQHFPDLEFVRAEVAFMEQIALARSTAKEGQFKTAFEDLAAAEALIPGDPRYREAEREVSNALLAAVRPGIAEQIRKGSAASLGAAVFAIRELSQVCELCRDQLGDLAGTTRAFEIRLSEILKENARDGSRANAWARCAIGAETQTVLAAPDSKYLLDLCDPANSGLHVGLVRAAGVECPNLDLEAALLPALPQGSEVVPLTSLRGGALGDVDLVISVHLTVCQSGSLGERNVIRKSSTYVNGVQQLVNPEYVDLQSRVARARQDLARAQATQNANPSNWGAATAVVTASIAVLSLESRLRKTPPFFENPLEFPYEYEVFEAGAASAVSADLEITDPQEPSLGIYREIGGSAQEWRPGARGVAASDRSGASNYAAELPSQSDLASKAATEFAYKLRAAVQEGLGLLLLGKASNLLQKNEQSKALGFLAISRLLETPDSDPDLARFRNERLKSLLLTRDDLAELSASLTVFESRVRSGSVEEGGGSGPASGARSGVLEGAIESVVFIERGSSAGTGFFVTPDGLVLTNHHLISELGPIAVTTSKGDAFLATVVRQDEAADLALLRISALSPSYLRLGNAETAALGAEVYAIGNPRGLRGSVSKGIVSAKRSAGGVRYLQVDVPINPGSSGGPVLLQDGTVVGVSTFKFRESEGLNFAVAAEEAKARFRDLLGP